MTKLAYLECPTGIAGDMCLGALINAGVPLEYLTEQLKGLPIEQEYQLSAHTINRSGQVATKVHVDLLSQSHHHEHHSHHHGRHLPEIESLITKADLPPRAEAWSLAVFRQLALAEGQVHGISPDKVHFHEVGAVDAIVDIVGTCLGFDWLGIDSNNEGLPLLYCSALPTGGGTVRAAHGQMAVPVPAVLKLWEMRGCPVYSNGIEKELVTPTGAAIATTLATDFGSPPAMTIERVGLGAGSRDLPIPNILRLWLGETVGKRQVARGTRQEGELSATHGKRQVARGTRQEGELSASHKESETNEKSSRAPLASSLSPTQSPYLETICVLETQIDDLSGQAIGYVFDALFAAGALDVFTQSIGMKKSRPGILISVICYPEQLPTCEAVLFRETTTLGIRRQTWERAILQREIQQVETEYGAVRLKVAWTGTATSKAIANVQPEYEDCVQIAQQHNLSWLEVHRLVLHTWYKNLS